MTRRSGGGTGVPSLSGELPRLAVLLVCFLCAGLLGCVMVSRAGDDGFQTLSVYLRGFFDLTEDGGTSAASLPIVVWNLCRWPLFVLLFGLTALGSVGIPALFCVRGFLLGYAVASFFRVFGHVGLLNASVVFAATALGSVPVFFCVGFMAFSNSLRLAFGALEGRPSGLVQRQQFFPLIPCGVLIAIAAALEYSVIPYLLSAAAGLLPVG